MSNGEPMSKFSVAFNIEILGKLVSNEQDGDSEALSSSFAWYLDTFLIAVQTRDVETMQGICDACMLVLDSIVDHDSTVMCQSMFISFLVQTKEHFPPNVFSKFRICALQLTRLLSWLIKEALSGNFDAKQFLEHLLECAPTHFEDDVLFLETCLVLSVEIMASSDERSLDHENIENVDQSPSSLRSKLVVLKTIFNAYIRFVESNSPKQMNFETLKISRESSLKSLDCIVKQLSENAAASLRSETRTASAFSHRETVPTFTLYGEIIEFLSKVLQVYRLNRLQDRTHIHFVYTLFIVLFETSAKMNSVTFMGHAALVCNQQLIFILDDLQKQGLSTAIMDFLSPKLQQLQTGKISGLSYEAVISIALRLMSPSSSCTEVHQLLKTTALVICNREEKIP